ADLEEAKTQENGKLQSALEEMEVRYNETKELLMKEREIVKTTIEKVPVIQEVPVVDHELMNKLTAENEKLKALVGSLEQKIGDTEKRYEETNKLSEERLKQALDAETKILQLKTAMQSLQEKVSEMASENQILRKQAFSSPTKHVPEHPHTPETNPIVENGLRGSEEPQAPASNSVTESDSKPKKPPIDRHNGNVDALIECVMKDTGFSQGKPVAAFTIYKCLLHWKSFECERTNVFDRLIQMIGSAIENQDNNEHMAYWLSNTSALVFLIQKSLRPEGSSSARKLPPPTSLFGRMTM
ncbi:myosin 2, partial [Tanacetum coccineum]